MRLTAAFARSTLSLWGALTLWISAPLSAEPLNSDTTRLTLRQCIDIGLERNQDLGSITYEVHAAMAVSDKARGNMGPKLRADANLIRWNKPVEESLSLPGLAADIPPLMVRDKLTSTVSVSAIQPLSALWGVYQDYKLAGLGVEATKLRLEAIRQDVTFQIIEAFYRLLQAMRLTDVAVASVEQIDGQLRKARSLSSQGVVGQNDVLRAELGLADAKGRAIQAKASVALARGRLATLLGLPMDAALEPTGVPTAAPPLSTMSGQEAERLALSNRVELREVETRIREANTGVRAAWSRMLPQDSLVASYQHNEGMELSEPNNAYYVGVFLTWNFWEWGATYYETHEARARLNQRVMAGTKIREAIRLDVRVAYIGVQTSAATLSVAEQAIAQAEENFRIESRRYEANANTSFDVLDAESLLTQARAQHETALYDHLIARAALDRAIGKPFTKRGVRRP